jgi:hypothetical protein
MSLFGLMIRYRPQNGSTPIRFVSEMIRVAPVDKSVEFIAGAISLAFRDARVIFNL